MSSCLLVSVSNGQPPDVAVCEGDVREKTSVRDCAWAAYSRDITAALILASSSFLSWTPGTAGKDNATLGHIKNMSSSINCGNESSCGGQVTMWRGNPFRNPGRYPAVREGFIELINLQLQDELK